MSHHDPGGSGDVRHESALRKESWLTGLRRFLSEVGMFRLRPDLASLGRGSAPHENWFALDSPSGSNLGLGYLLDVDGLGDRDTHHFSHTTLLSC